MNHKPTRHFFALKRKTSVLLCCCLLGSAIALAQHNRLTAAAPVTGIDAVAKANAEKWLKDDQTGFIENKGQIKDQDGKPNKAVKFLLNMPGLNVQLRNAGFSYDTWVTEPDKNADPLAKIPGIAGKDMTPSSRRNLRFHRVDIMLEGADSNAQMLVETPLPSVIQLIDGQQTYQAIHSYKKVTYKNVYPGIDLEFLAKKGTDKPVEYNFIVHPGANADQIRMKYNSGNDIVLKDGMIEMKLSFVTLRERIPASYTQNDGKSLAVNYKALAGAGNSYAFNMPDYDHSKTLVIDPTPQLVWATYIGGTELTVTWTYDETSAVKVDRLGNVIVAGTTSATTNVATAGTYQPTYNASAPYGAGYVVKYNASGVKTWGTYIHGNGNDLVASLCLDAANNIYVGMWGGSTNLPVIGTSHQSTNLGGGADGYIMKLNASGAYSWGTYLGSAGDEIPYTMNIVSDGNLIVGGYTSTGGAKIAFGTGFDQTFGGGAQDGFIVKLNATTAAGMWGTYIGGSSAGGENVLGTISDNAGNIYFAANSSSTAGLPITAGSAQPTYGGGTLNGVVGRLNSTGSAVLWCTYLGGAGYDASFDIQMGGDSNLVVFGITSSANMSTTGVYQPAKSGGYDGLITKYNRNGVKLWGTYYGGAGDETIHYGVINENNEIIFTGNTASTSDIASNCSFQPTYGGGANDCYLAKLNAAGNTRVWGTYFGGVGNDLNNGSSNDGDPLAYGGNGVLYMAGYTESTGLSTAGAPDQALNGIREGFVTKFTEGLAPNDLKLSTSTISPGTQQVCALGIPGNITGNMVSIFNPATFSSPIFFQWQTADAASGPWTNMAGEVFKDLTPLASNTTKYYRRLVLVNNGYCDKKVADSSSVANVTIGANAAPIANANGPQWFTCAASAVLLNGTATGGTNTYTSYQWYAGSNLTTPVASTQNYTTPNNLTAATTYTLKVTDNAGCTDIDQVTINPTIADAGPDSVMCQGTTGVKIGKPGAAGGSVAYSWSIVSGTTGSLSCTTCAQPVATPTAATTYRLTVTVTLKNNTTCVTTDDVTLSFVSAPTNGPLIAGTDKTICKSSTVVLGNGTADAGATYTWVPGNYLSATNVANPTFNAGIAMVSCPLSYTVTASKGGCQFVDQVNVSVINPAIDYQGQTVPCYVFSEQLNEPNCGNATYTWVVASGPGQQPSLGNNTLRDNGASAVLYNPGATNAIFYRNTTLNGVTCPSPNVTVVPCGSGCPPSQIKVVGDQGCPKVFPDKDLQLYLKNVYAPDWNFSWTPATIMDNPSSPSPSISSTAPATVDVVITNKITGMVCTTAALSINNPAWLLPPINTPDRFICPANASPVGETLVGGYTYEWTPAIGLDNPLISNPLATLANDRTYHVVKTETATGCTAVDDVDVKVQGIDYDAGADRAVCNGGTVTLGTVPGGSYTYSWSPAGAAYANGTSYTSANPQILFAGTNQTFTVTVTDPVTGCTKVDNVTLRGSVTPGEYAGAAAGPLCPGETAQLGRAADAGATYAWTPATGLSCTTCSNPTVMAGTANQTYTLNVSYAGCSTPASDAVTLSVKPVSPVVFGGQSVCPATPVNIGVGGTGNSASIANVATYSWSPATALSCTSCASPLANPLAATTYTATVTFTNGCVVTDDALVTPTVSATAKPDATICPGSSVQLGSPSQSGVTYAWSLVSGGPLSTLSCTNCAQPVANPTVTSVYRMSASITGCTVTDDVQITVKSLPAFNISGNTSVCAGGTTTLSVTPVTPNIIYQWSPLTGVASPNSPTTVISPTTTTTYKVVQSDLNSGCSDYKEVIVFVAPNNIEAIGGTIVVCPGTSSPLPLSFTPAFTASIVWSPATGLSSAYLQNPVIAPTVSGNYIATVTNNTTNCSDTAMVVVNVPASCNGSDFGDAPLTYDLISPASHSIVSALKIGTAIDAEGAPVSTALAIGDDLNQVANDEEGISFLPAINTTSKSVGVLLNSVLNNTGNTAYLVAWIDFNRDGDFDDIGERSTIVSIPTSTTASNPVLQFNGFNAGCDVKAGPSYMRTRLTTDISGGWDNAPLSYGSRLDGEVEDYAITIPGVDFGDAPNLYPTAKALVNPDADNDGKPDAAGSVWLGSKVDYPGCEGISSASADADDNDGNDDEDGLSTIGGVPIGYTAPWSITVNSEGPVTGVKWGMWIDWDADGVFDEFQNGSVNTASPTTFTTPVGAPSNAVSSYMVRLGVKTGDAFTANDYSMVIQNGEWEDYVSIAPLPVKLVNFDATSEGCNAVVKWTTSMEANTASFEIEHSEDGKSWKTVATTASGRNTQTDKSYSVSVTLKEGITNFIRLKVNDQNGEFVYSMVRVLRCDGLAPVIISPNPAKNKLVFSGLQGASTIHLLNTLGQLMVSDETTSTSHLMDISALSSGVYYAEVICEGVRIATQKIIKQ